MESKTFGTKTRCTIKNERYFENIDTPEKAYILGLLLSDGCVSNNQISISQHSKRACLLNMIADELGFEGYYNLNQQQTKKGLTYYPSLGFSNIATRRDLKRYGMVPGKTDNIRVPIFDQVDIVRHLLLGWFDGDGCIHYSPKKTGNGTNTTFMLAGTKNSMTDMVNLFSKYVGVSLKLKARAGKTYIAYCYNKSDIYKIYQFFYENSYIGLIDKKSIFESIINDYNLEGSSETWFDYDIDIEKDQFAINTHEINSILIGLVLGNSNILSSTRLRINNGSNDIEYFRRKIRMLEGYFTNITENVQITDNREYPYAYVKHNTKLKYLYEEFYKNGKKVLPDSLIRRITPDTLAVLFMERGTIKEDYLRIPMRLFSRHELTQLVNFIKNKYKIEFKLTILSGVHVLVTNEVDKFLELISPMYYRIQSIPLKLTTPRIEEKI